VGQVLAVGGAAAGSVAWFRAATETNAWGAGGAVFRVLVVITALYFAAAWLGPMLDERVFERSRARRLRAERLGRPFVKEMARLRENARKRLPPGALAVLDAAVDRLDRALDGESDDELVEALAHAETVLHEQLGKRRKGIIRDFTESIGGALLVALLLRLFVVEAFKIPSGSMIPTLLVGDHIFVNKFVYGLTIPFLDPPVKVLRWSDPQPGDVVVFTAPHPAENAGEDFIKRVVATEGQSIQLKAGVLHVDGKPYPRTPVADPPGGGTAEARPGWSARRGDHFKEEMGGRLHDVLYEPGGQHDWPTYHPGLNGLTCEADRCTVQEGYIFCMGDNRDNSADSRRWGAVPLRNVKGRAMFIWWSPDDAADPRALLPRIRWGRLGDSIH
jgi:signal peptidase I